MAEAVARPLGGATHGVERPNLEIALIIVAGLLARLLLIYRYPMIFGGDTIARLAMADQHVVLSHQLPLLEVAIHYVQLISDHLLLVRYLMAIVGAVAGAGFYLLMTNFAAPTVALDASLLFVANPLILADSIVPYQEILMLAGLLFAFHFALTERWGLSSVSLGVACLTRYEAWLACPVLMVAYLRNTGRRPRAVLAAIALFGWAPLSWMLYNRGITPAGSWAIQWSSNPERLLRWAHLAAVVLRNAAIPTLLLAVVGVAVLVRRRLWATPPYQALIAFGALFLVAILFSAHGVPPHPEASVTEREGHLPLTGVTLLAGVGLALVPRGRHVITALAVAVGLWMADRFVHRASSEPHVALSYQVAQYLQNEIPRDDQVAVLAHSVDVEGELARVAREHGPGAVHPFLAALGDLQRWQPPDYERIRVQSDRGRGRLRSYATWSLGRFADSSGTRGAQGSAMPGGRPEWVVLWSDFTPTNAVEADLANEALARTPRQVFHRDSVWVRLYALTPDPPSR